jgi:hypothetical protein
LAVGSGLFGELRWPAALQPSSAASCGSSFGGLDPRSRNALVTTASELGLIAGAAVIGRC